MRRNEFRYYDKGQTGFRQPPPLAKHSTFQLKATILPRAHAKEANYNSSNIVAMKGGLRLNYPIHRHTSES